jgi:hypothetical protein
VLKAPPVPGTEPTEGDIAIGGTTTGTSAWVIVNLAKCRLVAPTTTSPLRSGPGFERAVIVKTEPFAPSDRFTDTHDGYDKTDHDERFVDTVALTNPPAPGTEPEDGDTDANPPPCCRISTVANAPAAATTTHPVLNDDPGLAVAVTVKTAPFAPDIGSTDNHDGHEETDHDD